MLLRKFKSYYWYNETVPYFKIWECDDFEIKEQNKEKKWMGGRTKLITYLWKSVKCESIFGKARALWLHLNKKRPFQYSVAFQIFLTYLQVPTHSCYIIYHRLLLGVCFEFIVDSDPSGLIWWHCHFSLFLASIVRQYNLVVNRRYEINIFFSKKMNQYILSQKCIAFLMYPQWLSSKDNDYKPFQN